MKAYLWQRKAGLLVAVGTLLADIISKGVVLAHQFDLPVSVVQGWLALVLTWNYGMSFSFLNDPTVWWTPWLLGAVALGASAWFIHWLGEDKAWLHQLGLGLIIGGALGNLLDRISHGAVVDFILLYRGEWTFPAFNLADSAISLGVVFLLAQTLWYRERQQEGQ